MSDGYLHIESVFPVCPNCGGVNLKTNVWKDRTLIFPDTGKEVVKVKEYTCLNECNNGKRKYFKVNIDSIVVPNSNYTHIFKKKTVDLYAVGNVSLRNSAELMSNNGKINVSHQSVENWICMENKVEIPKPERFSGHYGFDIQWVRNYKEWNYHYLPIDITYNTIIADKYSLMRNQILIKSF